MDFKLEQIKASMDDAKDLFEWRNDPLTREMSLTVDEIVVEEHMKWFKNSISNINREIFIFINDGQKVGMGRVDKANGVSTLSWLIAPNARGKGYGKALVKQLADSVKGPKIALIKNNNAASIKIAECAGFKKAEQQNSILTFKKK